VADTLNGIGAAKRRAPVWRDKLRRAAEVNQAILILSLGLGAHLGAVADRVTGANDSGEPLADLAAIAMAGADLLLPGEFETFGEMAERITDAAEDDWPRTDFDRVEAVAAVLTAYSTVAEYLAAELVERCR
jgi:hypothetical protein